MLENALEFGPAPAPIAEYWPPHMRDGELRPGKSFGLTMVGARRPSVPPAADLSPRPTSPLGYP